MGFEPAPRRTSAPKDQSLDNNSCNPDVPVQPIESDDSASPESSETVNKQSVLNLPKKKLKLDISAVIPTLNHPLHHSRTSFKFMMDAGPHSSPLFSTTEHQLIQYNWVIPDIRKAFDITVRETFTAFAENLISGRDHSTALTSFTSSLNELRKRLQQILYVKLRQDYTGKVLDYSQFKVIKSQHSYRLRVITARIQNHFSPQSITYDDLREGWSRSYYLRHIMLSSLPP